MSAARAAPLGVFDSGLGGLTVVRALRAAMPDEAIVYLGDTARVPYGTKSADTILKYARSCASVLTRRGVKALVVACNTASAVGVEMLRAELDLPVVGVIEPGARAAVDIAERLSREGDPRSGRIGVLGTARTIASGAYTRAVAALSTRVEVIGSAAPLLVPLVEEGWIDGDVPRLAVERYLAPLIESEVGSVVLGCTHYPVLAETIAEAAARMSRRSVAVVDSARATAEAVALLLETRDLRASEGGAGARLTLLVTDLPASFAAMAERCLGMPAPEVALVDI
ncbi:MAG TPA: glutamate racemase [Polyangiaceae bacterium]|nr:glutamate racemase [Polyangiaceae bacterium]